jgi:hypothetical protein
MKNVGLKMIEVAALSEAWVYGRSPAGIAGSNRDMCMDVWCDCCV